ncbi:phage/plasmid primase, P4 family [Rhizorhabdus sp.]|uniref:phage/plasmid primase, P4 family n=1 Tax=Rhizorhabdus sp. TaxID=1968843 RepID=UPI0035B2C03A
MNANQTFPSPLGQAALGYVRRGWKVFPCREKDGEPYTNREGKHVTPLAKQPYIAEGFRSATRDEEQVKAWWRKWPNAMIGVPAGDNGLLIVDFDPRVDPVTGEVFELKALKEETEAAIGCELPTSLVCVTPSDGVHVYYKLPEGPRIGNRGNLPDHVDVRASGGYVIVPPSICEGGIKATAGRYRWKAGRQDTVPVDPPEGLVAKLRERGTRGKAKGAAADQAASSSPSPPAGSGRAPSAGATSAKLPDASAAVTERVRKYALSALDGECRELAATPIGGGQYGGRNAGIYHAALKMGSLVAAGAIAEAVVRAAIQDVIDRMPANDDPDGARTTLANGLRDGLANPRDLREIEEAARARASRSRGAGPSTAARLGAPAPDPASGREQQSFRSEGNRTNEPGGGRGDNAEDVDPDGLNRRCAFFPHTDLGNAERFRERFGRDFCWSPALGWMGWDGRRWAALDQDEKSIPAVVMQAVFDTVRAIQDEALFIAMSGVKKPDVEYGAEEQEMSLRERRQMSLWLETGQRSDALDYVQDTRGLPLWSDIIRKWGRTSEAQGKLTAIANIARSWLAVRVEAFDADPLAVNVLNGTLRFSKVPLAPVDGKPRWKASVTLTPHRREDMLSKLAPVLYDPVAASPIYDDMFAWAQPKPAMRRYIHAWGGLSMTSEVGLQILQFWYGLGGNGKSTVMDMWCEALGDYSDTIPIESFLDQGIKKRGDQASPDLAKLAGVRLLRTSEPDEGAKLSTGLIKLVTGGEPVPVRHLNRGFFNLKVHFKLTVQGNHKPEIRQTDDGIWRRVKLVHWGQRVRDETNPNGTRDKDPYLKDKMQPELSGIFNHLVAGLLDYLENGLVEADDVTADTAQYRSENDPLARFLKLCTTPDPEGRARSSKLYELFQAWCKVAQETEWKQKGFSRAMLSKGYRTKASDGMHWLGIRMVRTPDEFVDPLTGKARDFSLDDGPSDAPPTPPPEDRAPGWGDPEDGLDPLDDYDRPL